MIRNIHRYMLNTYTHAHIKRNVTTSLNVTTSNYTIVNVKRFHYAKILIFE